MNQPGVMQVIDTLVAAGAERVAVNIANQLPRDRYRSYLCTTREDGPLDGAVGPGVGRLRLQRSSRFDVAAIHRLVKFIRENDIRILHAHSSGVFIARMAAAFAPHPAVIWHAHYGKYVEHRRPVLYRAATHNIAGVITVNRELARWCTQRLHVPRSLVWHIANPSFPEPGPLKDPELPGVRGQRIVCLANFRPEKDHHTLLLAMSRVIRQKPEAHLALAGKTNDAGYLASVRKTIAARGLDRNVTILGERQDTAAILRHSDIGVLSSTSEGMPMSLLEYGMAGLPCVATRVGQCPEVLDQGGAGILVPASDSERLADGLLALLERPELRQSLGTHFQRYVNYHFSPDRIIGQICQIYESLDGSRARPASFAKEVAACKRA